MCCGGGGGRGVPVQHVCHYSLVKHCKPMWVAKIHDRCNFASFRIRPITNGSLLLKKVHIPNAMKTIVLRLAPTQAPRKMVDRESQSQSMHLR